MSRHDLTVDAVLIVSIVGGERRHRAIYLIEQGADLGRVIDIAGGQRCRRNPSSVGVNGDVQLTPQRSGQASAIVPPRSSAVPSDTAEIAPTMRDRHLKIIAERGRMAWQKASGYNWRALVEADISRFKRVYR